MWAGPLVDRRECSRVRLPTPIVCVAYCTLRCHCTLHCTHMAYCYLFGVAGRFQEASKTSKNCIALNIVFHCTMHMVHYCIYIYIVYCIYLQCNVVFQHIGISIVIQKWPHRETCQVWQRRGGHCSNACRFGFLRLIIILLSSCSHHQNHQTGITQFLWKIIMSKQIKLCFSNTHISNSFDY